MIFNQQAPYYTSPRIKNQINYPTETIDSFPLLPTPSFGGDVYYLSVKNIRKIILKYYFKGVKYLNLDIPPGHQQLNTKIDSNSSNTLCCRLW
ncbi:MULTISPECIES: hypothetical protein [Okeania]|uniref:hypothetical protein n=1 Tax=Okeania TaxID=1458928 RepID=UPI000F52121E|nr:MULTISPECIES: hypothetical protein [Okeania]NET78204.1 hypothetical protein [Okeania sp. SIO1F9]RQH21796.1 hypothetical protein D4Z78_08940 [Okeania hirsuta]